MTTSRIEEKPVVRINEGCSVTVPDGKPIGKVADDETPAASLTTPAGDVIDLTGDVVFLPAVAATDKQAAVPARWQVLTQPLTELGEHTIKLGAETHTVVVADRVNPKKKRREARTRADAAEQE